MSLEDVSLEQRDELAQLMKELADNPATRKEVLRLTKKVRPSMNIPEIEMEDYTEKKISNAEERVMQLEAKLREKDAVDELNKRRQSLVKKGLASEDQIDAIEKLMLEKGMTNHETAAEYFDWMQQAAVPTPSGYNPNPLKGFDLSKFWKDPKMAARNSAAEALAELRKNNRPIGI
jgi:hypothetical protein